MRRLTLPVLVSALLLTAASASPQSDRLVRRAAALTKQKQYTQAGSLLRTALRLDPRSAEAHFRFGYVLSKLNRHEEAVGEFRTALKDHSDANWQYQLAFSTMQLKRYPEAIAGFRKTLALNPKDGDAFYNLGFCYDATQQYEQALEAYRQAERCNPKDYEAIADQGKALLDLKRYAEARQVLDRALKLKPDYAPSLSNRAIALDYLGEREAGLADVDAALKQDHSRANYHATRASLLSHLGRLEEAAASYAAALRCKDVLPFVYKDSAFTLVGLGEGEGAAANAERFIRIAGWKNPSSAYAGFAGYLGYRQAGRREAALRMLAQIPTGQGWPSEVARFLKGEILSADLIAAAKGNEQMTEARAYSGFLLALDGNRDLALEHLEWVSAHGVPTFVETVAARGWVQRLKAQR
jgi:tetratricopeptide (TPR) repeat protein